LEKIGLLLFFRTLIYCREEEKKAVAQAGFFFTRKALALLL
jgi:hypothetical protein